MDNPYNPSNKRHEEDEYELANRLDHMNMDQANNCNYERQRLQSQDSNDSAGGRGGESGDNYYNEHRMSVDEENVSPNGGDQRARNRCNEGHILIVTNLDPAVFTDRPMKAKFESLFSSYDERVTIRYLKSFRRVRLDFTSCQRAERARTNLNNYKLGTTAFKCFTAQIIRPNFDNSSRDSQGERIQRVHGPETDDEDADEDEGPDMDEDEDEEGNFYRMAGRSHTVKKGYLNIPKLTRQYLISPPMSPPEDWRPMAESEPVIDVQLLAAIANLVPGQTHELHAGTESQPGIVVEVCEEPYFDTTSKLSCKNRLPKTTIPGTPRPEPASLTGACLNNQMQL